MSHSCQVCASPCFCNGSSGDSLIEIPPCYCKGCGCENDIPLDDGMWDDDDLEDPEEHRSDLRAAQGWDGVTNFTKLSQ